MSTYLIPVYGYCLNKSCKYYNKKVKGVRKTDNKLNAFCPTCDNKLYMFKMFKETKENK